jgi:hypothetical protein
MKKIFITQLKNNKLLFKNIQTKNHDHHTIVKSLISIDNWKEIDLYYQNNPLNNKETYGFLLVKKKLLVKRKKIKRYWTPKSQKILKELDF